MRPLVSASGVALALLLASSSAQAIERQHHFGIGAGLSLLKIDDKPTLDVGGGLGVHYAYGVTDQFNFMVEGTSSLVARNVTETTPTTRPSTVESLAFGGSYVLDVLRWVPYVGILASGYAMTGGSLTRTNYLAGIQVAAGLDYQVTRSIAVGLAIRQHMLFSDISTYPTYTQVFLRTEYMWGW
ncbi:MAG: outer membrane beta-barrel protein [Polyangiaceae bacterium]